MNENVNVRAAECLTKNFFPRDAGKFRRNSSFAFSVLAKTLTVRWPCSFNLNWNLNQAYLSRGRNKMNSKKRDVRHGNDPLRNVPRWNVSSQRQGGEQRSVNDWPANRTVIRLRCGFNPAGGPSEWPFCCEKNHFFFRRCLSEDGARGARRILPNGRAILTSIKTSVNGRCGSG